MRQRNVMIRRAGTAGFYLALLGCIGLIAGCATYSGAMRVGDEAVRFEATAWEYVKQERYEEAEKYMTMAIEKFEETIRMCKMALDCSVREDPSEIYAILYSSRGLFRAGGRKFTLAIQDARTAIGYDDSNARAHFVLGYCSAGIGDLDTATNELAILESLDQEMARDLDVYIASVKRAALKKPRLEELPLRTSKEPQEDLTTFIKKK